MSPESTYQKCYSTILLSCMKLSKVVRGNQLGAHTFQHLVICKTSRDTVALLGIQVLCPLWLLSNKFFVNPWCVEQSEFSPKRFCETDILTKESRYTMTKSSAWIKNTARHNSFKTRLKSPLRIHFYFSHWEKRNSLLNARGPLLLQKYTFLCTASCCDEQVSKSDWPYKNGVSHSTWSRQWQLEQLARLPGNL